MRLIARWAAAFGYRNIVYIACVGLLALIGWELSTRNPSNTVRAVWYYGLTNWAGASLLFFGVNAVLAVVALVKGESPRIPLIACALPVLCIVVPRLLAG